MDKDKNILQQISKKLSILISLQLQHGKEKVEVKENVLKLAPFDLTDNEMAEILGTTPGTVSVAKVRIKKAKSK